VGRGWRRYGRGRLGGELKFINGLRSRELKKKRPWGEREGTFERDYLKKAI